MSETVTIKALDFETGEIVEIEIDAEALAEMERAEAEQKQRYEESLEAFERGTHDAD